MPQESSSSSTEVSTSDAATAQGVNSAQTSSSSVSSSQQQQPSSPQDISGLIASYEQRIRQLMSAKDTAINERNQAIANLSTLQSDHTHLQEQTQGSLTAAANAAQQALDNAKHMEQDLAAARAANTKLMALMQRPHLAPYADLIPAKSDEGELKAILDQLETIRQQDLERNRPALPATAHLQQQDQQPSSPASFLQSLYGNRATMHPNAFVPTSTIPASSPAQMNPNATENTSESIQALFDEARRAGTKEAYDQALAKAQLLAASQLSSAR